ncbi:uncharacterized protein G6M90_00g062530 [Metarhizium brunneum]|uniref:FluG domain-containing protein n=1 Tax=Metarhizium brunneum TaxID=500148 RepID=A0A7D5YTL8_9HYPO
MLYRRSNQGRVVNANDCEEIRKHIHGRLKSQFNLDDQPGSKPVMGVDDLLLGLTQHWCRDRSVFPTEDDRLDLATIMLFQSYTACRPAELVDGTKCRGGQDPLFEDLNHDDAATGMTAKRSLPMSQGITQYVDEHSAVSGTGHKQEESEQEHDSDSDNSVLDTDDPYDSDGAEDTESDDEDSNGTTHQGGGKWQFKQAGEPMDLDEAEEDHEIVRKHKALCYEDIVLWLVQDPNGGDRDVLAMEVMFRHHKGAKNKPKPTIFLFRENPLPILCPISHILARAIRDDAIEVEGFNKASRLFSSHIRRSATRVYWKSSILKTPVFRRSIRTAGGWVKSNTEPMKYSTYAFYLDRIGTELGSEEKWTSYCFRRGHANALLGIAPDSIVDQVMRHDPLTGCLQNAYQNSRVGFNTQDAFLERDPSADGLTRAFTHMSIKCNPEVPKQIPKAELAKLPPDPEVVRLAKQVEVMARRMRQDYGFIKAAPETVREEYQQLRKDLRNTEKAFRDDMTKVYQEECRRRLHNEELQRQLSEMPVDPELGERAKLEPSVQHQLEERTKLQAILSDFRQDLDAKATTDRKVRAVELMVLLASLREVRRPTVSTSSSLCQGSIRPGSPDIKPAVPNVKVEEIPLVLGETQCIYCVGEEQLPYSRRMRSFGRKSHMWDHVENLHLKYERKNGPFTCPHPHCRPLGDSLRSLTTFKNHVQRVHGVRLRG